MATSKLTFSIGSVFSGEGFQKANNAVRTLGATTKTAAQIANPLVGAMGALDQSSSKLVRSVGGVGTAFAQLGIAGAIIAGAQVGIDALFDHWKKGYDAMVQESERAAQAMQKMLNNTVARVLRRPADALAEVKTGAERAQKAFEAMANAALKVSKATAQTGIARGNLEVANLESLKTNGIIGLGDDKEGAALYAAQRDIEIAEAKYKQVRLEQSAAVEEATREAEIAAENERLVSAKLKKAREALAVATDAESRLSHLRDKSHAQKAAAMRAQAEELVAATERELAAKQADARAAVERRTQAELDAARATQAASGAVVEQKAAAEALAAAQKKAADKAELEERLQGARLGGQGQIGVLDGQIAAARENAAQWEKDFGAMRGLSMKEQQRALRNLANRKGQNGRGGGEWDNTTQARELERLEKMANERGRSMTKGQLEKLEQLRNLRDIRKNGNPFENELKKLEAERARAVSKMAAEIDAINKKIAGLA